MVTEDDIKKVVLKYLKKYYKFRPRGEGGTISLLNMRTASGIIADGYLTFKKEDGTDFLATFEATSEGTKEEVVYTYRWWFLFWDVLLGASFFTVLILAGNYYGEKFTLDEVGIRDFLIAIGLILVAFSTLIAMIIRKSSKYRYIYAIQQFKEYHADNQWVAIGTDVFPHTGDLKFRELKKQCIYNGFGLIQVTNELEPHFIATPSRTDLFGDKRRTAEFLTESELVKKVTQNKFAGVFGKIFNKTFKKMPKFGFKALNAKERARAYVSQLKKYRKTAYPQIAGTSLMLTAIAGIFFLEMLNADFVKLDERRYLKEDDIAKFQKKSIPETRDYMIDSSNIVPFDRAEDFAEESGSKNEKPILQPEEEEEEPEYEFVETTEDKPDPVVTEPKVETETKPETPTPTTTLAVDTLSKTGVGIYSPDIASNFVIYDCSRFLNFTGKQYLVQESYHPSLEAAKSRIQFLANYSISSNYLWMGCFSDTHTGYIVFVDYLYSDKAEAKENARGYQLDLKRKQIFLEPLRIKTLQINE